MKKTRWKFLHLNDGKIKSAYGDCTWKIGERKKEDKVHLCNSGFHCSKKIYEAFSYIQGEILAEVEVGGKCEKEDNKECYTEMEIIHAYKWTKKDSIALSIYAAELVLDNYEKQCPGDLRPRQAIDAAKKVLENDTEENRSAAESAAKSAWSARSAAESAAKSARSAARSAAKSAAKSAWSAAESAAESAAKSAWSAAWSAAESAAKSAIIKKIDKWMNNRIKELETYE